MLSNDYNVIKQLFENNFITILYDLLINTCYTIVTATSCK